MSQKSFPPLSLSDGITIVIVFVITIIFVSYISFEGRWSNLAKKYHAFGYLLKKSLRYISRRYIHTFFNIFTNILVTTYYT